MSQENVDVVRRMFDAFNRGDVDAVIATFDEGCVVEEPREMPDSPSLGFRGHDGIREWMANLRGVAGVRFEPRSFTTGGDVVVSDVGLARPGAGQRRARRVDDLRRAARCATARSRGRRPSSAEMKPSKPPGCRSRRCRRRTGARSGRMLRRVRPRRDIEQAVAVPPPGGASCEPPSQARTPGRAYHGPATAAMQDSSSPIAAWARRAVEFEEVIEAGDRVLIVEWWHVRGRDGPRVRLPSHRRLHVPRRPDRAGGRLY